MIKGGIQNTEKQNRDARRRAKSIMGVSPVFQIPAKGDDQSLKADLVSRFPAVIPGTQAGRL
jgi:hypothetical protein